MSNKNEGKGRDSQDSLGRDAIDIIVRASESCSEEFPDLLDLLEEAISASLLCSSSLAA